MLGGLGWPEVGVLLLLGLVLFGPERLPQMAADAATALQRMRKFFQELQRDLRAELGPEIDELDLRSLDPKAFVRKHLLEAPDDVETDAARRPSDARAVLAVGEKPPWDPDAT